MRFRTDRPTRRVFIWWLILTVAVLAGAEARAATSKTAIVDVLYRADGTPAQGTLLISWPAFTTAGGDASAAGSMTVNLGTNGSVQAAIFPNTGSTPQGTYYKVVVDLDDGTRSTEYWVVPQVPQTTIAAVRSSLVPQSQAMQFVGRDYVDSAIASAVGSNVAVELTGSQTITGVKTFQNSPQVPTPTNSGDAANRQFVLDTVGNSAPAQTTPGTVNATQYQVNGTALASSNLSDAASLAKVSQIPTQTSQLTNNSGFIAASGAPVQSVNGQTGAVSLTIPAAQVSSDWNASTGVAQILNKPAIPSFPGVTSDGANGIAVTGNVGVGSSLLLGTPNVMQAWHDALPSTGGKLTLTALVVLPSTLTISKNNVEIECVDGATISGAFNGPLITGTGINAPKIHGCGMTSTFTSGTAWTPLNNAIRFVSVTNAELWDTTFYGGLADAVVFQGGTNNKIHDFWCTGVYVGCVSSTWDGTNPNVGLQIVNAHITGTNDWPANANQNGSAHDINLEDATNFQIINANILDNGTLGTYGTVPSAIQFGPNHTSVPASGVISNPILVATNGLVQAGIDWGGGTGVQVNGMSFSSPLIAGYAYCLKASNLHNGNILGMTIKGGNCLPTGEGVLLSESSAVSGNY